MKKILTAAILAAPLVTDTAIAQDNKLDLAELKCRELFVMQREQIKIVMAWLQAYYLEEDAPPIVDLEKLAANELKLSGYCFANPQDEVISAAEALFGKSNP